MPSLTRHPAGSERQTERCSLGMQCSSCLFDFLSLLFRLLEIKKSQFFLISHVGNPQLSQEMEIISQSAAVSSAVDKGDSKAVDEALEGKPEESHG